MNEGGTVDLVAVPVECVSLVSIKGTPELDIGRSGLPDRRARSREVSNEEDVLWCPSELRFSRVAMLDFCENI